MAAVTKHSPPACEIPYADASADSRRADWTRAFFPSQSAATQIDAAERRLCAVQRTLQIAQVLAQSDRPVDLSGLEDWVGRLTASVLDLEPIDGRRMRPALIGLLSGLDRLQHTVTSRAPPQRDRE